ncbi:hypothetical protein B484DRAFT_456134 [Ochromonadaceae sp. CCMP2298]|nr:hypothetical protein B484DRAFT_456134 [Ochromonadaceae sp. CCMP2298]
MSQRSSRKRSSFEANIEDEEERDDENRGNSNSRRGSSGGGGNGSSSSSSSAPAPPGSNAVEFNFDLALKFDTRGSVFKVSGKEEDQFAKVANDAQKQLVKAVVRSFLMKGGRLEVTKRSALADLLGKIDPAYKKLVTAVLARAQVELKEVFGYALVSGDRIQGLPGGKKDEYYVTSSLLSTNLAQLIGVGSSSSSGGDPQFGFRLMVLLAILMAPGQKITLLDLLRQMRGADPRFPQDISTGSHAKALAVPELGEDFIGLINRMKKEHYLGLTKDENDAADQSKAVYSLGPRFYLDVGKQNLVRVYFASIGQPVDMSILKDIEEDETRLAAEQAVEHEED